MEEGREVEEGGRRNEEQRGETVRYLYISQVLSCDYRELVPTSLSAVRRDLFLDEPLIDRTHYPFGSMMWW